MTQGTGGEVVGFGMVDVTGVPLAELARLVETRPDVRECMRRVVEEVTRGGDAVAGFNSSV